MNKLVQSNRNKKNNSLARGNAITPKESFSMKELSNSSNDKAKPQIQPYEPKPASMKIDTEIRDRINSLTIIGYGENQKEVVDLALNNLIETFPEEMKRKYNIQYEALRERSIKKNQ